MITKSELGVGLLERVRAIFENEDLYAIEPPAEICPAERHRRGGRPAEFPPWFLLAAGSCVDTFCSARAFFTELESDPSLWAEIRTMAMAHGHSLRSAPPSRAWYVKAKNRQKWATVRHLKDELTEKAIPTANEIGLLDPNASRNTSHPRPECCVTSDGKVITPPSRFVPGNTRTVRAVDRFTGEVTFTEVPVKNVDPDAKPHKVGGKKEAVTGSKFWLSTCRGPYPHARVILQVEHVPEAKGEKNSEGDIFVKRTIELAAKAPGMQAMIADGVVRDVHRAEIIRQTGLTVMSPTHAASKDSKSGDRTEKERLIKVEQFDRAGADPVEVEVWACAGRLCQMIYAVDGTRLLEPLKRLRTMNQPNADGTWRSYVSYALPDPSGVGTRTVTVSALTSPEDRARGLLRGEYIHQIPPSDPDWRDLYPRRSDSESINRGIDDHLPIRRARSYGAKRQLFDLLCHQFAVNSLARSRHRRRSTQDLAA